jgi:hypothetical protein
MEFPVVTGGESAQVFTPSRIVAITATVPWTPTLGDIAFCVPDDTTMVLSSGALAATLSAGSIRGISMELTYTFSTSFNLEVM